jgi:hypothetical protein
LDARDVDVIDAMRTYGGGFVKALAEAASRADEPNLALIKSTWPDYWIQYAELAEKRRAHEAKRVLGDGPE